MHRALILMRLYAQHGRRGAALKQYQVCVSVLQRELGAESEADTKQIYQEVLQRRSVESEPHARTNAGHHARTELAAAADLYRAMEMTSRLRRADAALNVRPSE